MKNFLKKTKRKKAKKNSTEFSKKIIVFITINSIIMLYLSYVLAYLDRVQIAESLSQTVATTIISVCISYFVKSAVEKTNRYGSRINRTAKEFDNMDISTEPSIDEFVEENN